MKSTTLSLFLRSLRAFTVLVFVLTPPVLWSLGLPMGLEFTGGTEFQVSLAPGVDEQLLRHHIDAAARPELRGFQVFAQRTPLGRTSRGADRVFVRVPSGSANPVAALSQVLVDGQETRGSIIARESVGPAVGDQVRRDTGAAFAWASLGLVAFLAWRFGPRAALASTVALAHDACIVLIVLALLRVEIDTAVVAALLTSLGYSANDSIVVLDRMRENQRLFPQETGAERLLKSLRQTLSRTLITGITVLATLVTFLMLGPPALQGFALTMLVGTVVGTLSTYSVVTPILAAPGS